MSTGIVPNCPKAVNGDSISVLLTATGQPAGKWFRMRMGEIKPTVHAGGKWFNPHEFPINSLDDLHEAMKELRRQPTAFVVRGRLDRDREQRDNGFVRSTVAENCPDAPPFYKPEAHRWIIHDLDAAELPAGMDVTKNIYECWQYIVKNALPDWYQNASYIAKASSSCAVYTPSRLSGHVMFWLDRSLTGAEIKQSWFDFDKTDKGKRAAEMGLKFDGAVYGDNQKIFTADPQFKNMPQSLPEEFRMILIRKGTDTVAAPEISVPELQPVGNYQVPMTGSRGNPMTKGMTWQAIMDWMYDAPTEANGGQGGSIYPNIRSATFSYAYGRIADPRADQLVMDEIAQRVIAFGESNGGKDRARAQSRLKEIPTLMSTALQKVGVSSPDSRAGESLGIELDDARRQQEDFLQAYMDASREYFENVADAKMRERAHRANQVFERRARARRIKERGQPELPVLRPPEKNPLPPAPLYELKITTGSGKTFTALELVEMQDDGRRFALLTETVKLGREVMSRFKGTAVQVLGRSQPDPNIDGKLMCWRIEKVNAVVAAGGNVAATCCKKYSSVCPDYGNCGYQRQEETDAKIVFGTHEALFSDEREPFAGTTSVIIDEAMHGAAIKVMELDIVDLDLCQLKPGSTPKQEEGFENLKAFLAKLKAVFEKADQGPLVLPEGHGLYNAARFNALGLMHRPLAFQDPSYEGMPSKCDLKIYGAAMFRRELLFRLPFRNDPSGQIARVGNKIRITFVQHPMKSWRVKPTLIMSATLEPKLNEFIFTGHSESVAKDIRVASPHQYLTQVGNKSFSKTSLIPLEAPVPGQTKEAWQAQRKAALALATEVYIHIVVKAQLSKGKGLVVTYMDLEKLFNEWGLPDNVSTGHFNAIAGLDGYKDVDWIIPIGRPLPSSRAAEDLAGAYSGVRPERQEYKPVGKTLLTKDGSYVPVVNTGHQDELVGLITASTSKGQIEQSVGRGRGVSRTAKTRLEIEVLTNTATDLAVDRVLSWDQLRNTALDLPLSEGIDLLDRKDLVIAYPCAFKNAAAVKYARRAHPAQIGRSSRWVKLEYRKVPNLAPKRAGRLPRKKVLYYDPIKFENETEVLEWLEKRVLPRRYRIEVA